MLRDMLDVTRILSQIEQGDQRAADELLPLVYEELRKLAAAKLAMEKPGQTLQATALVHEAWLRLTGGGEGVGGRESGIGKEHPHPDPLPEGEGARQHWNSRGHFFGAAAEAMRRILVENARRKRGPQAGGGFARVQLSDVEIDARGPDLDVLELNEALARLQTKDARAAELVKLRFFAGLTRHQAAEVLGISVATADNDWAYAKGWLKAEMTDGFGLG